MSRADALGLFWQDVTKVKIKKEQVKRTPPARTWEAADYLPNLAEAEQFNIQVMSDDEMYACAFNGDRLYYDIEVYPNYFLAGFQSKRTGKVVFFERCDDLGWVFDFVKLKWLMENALTVGFNSLSYDLPITNLAIAGKSNIALKRASDEIIVDGYRPYEILRAHKVRQLKVNHVDLIEVAPLRAGLKTYAGRFHAERMQDLPFRPDTILSPPQISITRWYNVNDLANTKGLDDHLSEQMELRERMSVEYKVDLRSKSDAQIAETVIGTAIEQIIGSRERAPEILAGTIYYYKVPSYLSYRSCIMQWVLERVRNAEFIVAEHGAVGMPETLKNMMIPIAGSTYRMGIGGLHSSEESIAHVADDTYCIVDRDVASYYPRIILNQGLYPSHLGQPFLQVYRNIVDRRLACKRAGDKAAAETLKIVINGTFGKLANKYSDVYSPDLGVQVTVTGQLTLLMLIERLEWEGINVISANTDGVVVKCRRTICRRMNEIVAQWEVDTGFETEEVEYTALYSRDVNNYIAIKKEGGYKGKGAFSNPWSDKKLHAFELHKNPQNTICIDAVTELLISGTPIDHTVTSCTDIRKFVTVRSVTGGAVKDGEFLGKQIRWYYGKNAMGEIIYAKSGNKVPRSEGAIPLMLLPETLPTDIDYDWYVRECYSILEQIGITPVTVT